MATVKFRQFYVPDLVLSGVPLLFGHLVVRSLFKERFIPFEIVPTLRAVAFSGEWLTTVPAFNFALWILPILVIPTGVVQLLQTVTTSPSA